MQRIHFRFLAVGAIVEIDWPELAEVLKKDFWSFIVEKDLKDSFVLKITNTPERPAFFEMKASRQSQNAITYDYGNERFCDYYSEAFTIINFDTNEAHLYSSNFDKAHEVAYLLILSRIGKKLDLLGFHKLHAFAVSFNHRALVCMMPSKGGKSTLLLELLKDPRVKMLSDDIPLVSSSGHIYSFPLKLGLNHLPEEGLDIDDMSNNVYEMKRTSYGVKKLISTKGLGKKVENEGSCFTDVILVSAHRFNGKTCALKEDSWAGSLSGLFVHGVIGLGTPMILEYFWENGFRDFMIKTRIFFQRCMGFLNLALKSKRLSLELGANPDLAAKVIINYLEQTQR